MRITNFSGTATVRQIPCRPYQANTPTFGKLFKKRKPEAETTPTSEDKEPKKEKVKIDKGLLLFLSPLVVITGGLLLLAMREMSKPEASEDTQTLPEETPKE